MSIELGVAHFRKRAGRASIGLLDLIQQRREPAARPRVLDETLPCGVPFQLGEQRRQAADRLFALGRRSRSLRRYVRRDAVPCSSTCKTQRR